MYGSTRLWLVALLAASTLAAAAYTLSLPEAPLKSTSPWLKLYHDYMAREYGVRPMPTPGPSPAEAHVEGVPWISYDKPYCPSTCLQMVAYWAGLNESLGSINLAMCLTYGAFLEELDGVRFAPVNDPFKGFKDAARYLGLECRVEVANDPHAYQARLRELVARGVPVIVPVNAARVYNVPGFAPHVELLVGYEGDVALIYEPVEERPRFAYGVRGVEVSLDQLVRANRDVCEAFMMPWRHMLIYFVEAEGPREGLVEALRRAGESLVGGRLYWMCFGAEAVEALANYTAEGRVRIEDYAWALEMARDYRQGDAEFLEEAFRGRPLVVEAASELRHAANLYAECLRLMEGGVAPEERGRIAELLRLAAMSEGRAGELLIEASKLRLLEGKP